MVIVQNQEFLADIITDIFADLFDIGLEIRPGFRHQFLNHGVPFFQMSILGDNIHIQPGQLDHVVLDQVIQALNQRYPSQKIVVDKALQE